MNENLPDNPQIQVLKSGKTGLFTNYIYKAIPLAFDESMSYYETLCGLLNYLKNVVIPTVNNNADAVAELQGLYEQLRTYVDDYFTNLDVQEEINNKLDAMVEDGTLDQIIEQYLNSSAIWGFNSVNDMKNATNLINGSYARTLGFYSYNDMGGALYKIRTITNQDVIDEITIISLNDNNLIAELIPYQEMNFIQFGAKLNNNDDSEYIQKAINYAGINHIKLNGLGLEYIVSDYTELDSNYGIVINKSINIKNLKLKLKDNSPDMTTLLLININDDDIVTLDNINLNGNYLNQSSHTTPSQDGGRHGIRMYGKGTLYLNNSIIHDCYSDNLLFREGTSNIYLSNIKCYNAGRNGITNNAYNSYLSNINLYDNGKISNPKSGFHIEPDGNTIMNDLIINNMTIDNSTVEDFKIHHNNLGHIINNIKINNLSCNAFTIANTEPVDTNNPNFVNKLLIENSNIGKITYGPVTSTQYAGVKESIINNSTINGLEIKNVLFNKLNSNNTKYLSTISLLNKIDLYFNNCDFSKDTYVESDAQNRVGILAIDTNSELNNVIIENSNFINNSRGIRTNKANNITVKNCIFHTYNNNINIGNITNALFITNNRSLGGSNFVGGTSGNIISIGNDLRELTTLYSSGFTVTENCNLTNT